MIFFLANTKNLGNTCIKKAYKRYKKLSDILNIDNKEIEDFLGCDEKKKLALNEMKENVDILYNKYLDLEKRGIKFCSIFDRDYPKKLRHIEKSPLYLYYKGDIKKLNNKSVAIVGSRLASEYGKKITKDIVSFLAKKNINIISGLALGIDSIAHREALKNNLSTYAVLGCGLNICYPKENIAIFEDIINTKKGAVISEYQIDEKPYAYNFPNRNRIISALSDVIIVVEAKEKSGSLISASYGMEQGKDVYVVPGRYYDILSAGANKLIKDGANILTDFNEILESLGIYEYEEEEKDEIDLLEDERLVYNTLDFNPKYLEDIINESKLEYQEVIGIILNLELRGIIKNVTGNYYIRCS